MIKWTIQRPALGQTDTLQHSLFQQSRHWFFFHGGFKYQERPASCRLPRGEKDREPGSQNTATVELSLLQSRAGGSHLTLHICTLSAKHIPSWLPTASQVQFQIFPRDHCKWTGKAKFGSLPCTLIKADARNMADGRCIPKGRKWAEQHENCLQGRHHTAHRMMWCAVWWHDRMSQQYLTWQQGAGRVTEFNPQMKRYAHFKPIEDK